MVPQLTSKVDNLRPAFGFDDISLAPGTDTADPSDVDLSAERGLARKSGSNRTRFEEGFDAVFHERVATGFRSLAAAEPARWRVLDASAEQGALAAEIAQIVHVALSAKR